MNATPAPDPMASARKTLVVIIVLLTAASALYRILALSGLQHTSLVFIGIPAVLALLTVMSSVPKSATGMILKVITLVLLISGILFGEAFVCILFAAPLFYAVGLVIGLLADFVRRRDRKRRDINFLMPLLALVLVPASLEGVIPGFAFERDDTVRATRLVAGSASEVAAALAGRPSFDRLLPAFFRLGFPMPGVTEGSGLSIGDRRAIEFRHGRHPGTLVVEVSRSEPGHVDFEPVADDSYITHWLAWRRMEVRWVEIAPGQTLVSWTLEYRRRLDPAWYFAPLEAYGARLAAGYLIDTLATPHAPGSDVFCRGFFTW